MQLNPKLPVAAAAAALLLATGSHLVAGEVALKGAELGKWTMDYDAALKLAKEKSLPILINFTGSDWCGWCKLMDEAVYAKPEWQKYAAQNILTVTIDFPQKKSAVPQEYVERNEKLKEQFGVEGFPTYVILDKDGATELGRLGAGEDKTPESFIKELTEVIRFSPSNIEAKMAALGAEKGAEFRAAVDAMRGAEKQLVDWLETQPKRSPENDKTFQEHLDKIEAAKAKAGAF